MSRLPPFDPLDPGRYSPAIPATPAEQNSENSKNSKGTPQVEALRLFDSARTNPDLVLAEKLLAWLRVRYGPNSGNSNAGPMRSVLIYPVLIYQHGPNAVRDKATAKRIIGILENHGWLYRMDGGTVVDDKHQQDVWTVHPALWEEK